MTDETPPVRKGLVDAACPACGERVGFDVEAILPEQTDLTLSINIEPGQLCMAKTIAGVIDNFAKMQIAIAKEMGCTASVFIAGLSYENDTIAITFRVANTAKGKVQS